MISIDKSLPSAKRARLIEQILLGLSGLSAVGAEILAVVQQRENSPVVIGLALFSLLLSGRKTFQKGWGAVRGFRLNINFLMTIAIAGAILIGEWPEAAMVSFLFAVAELIEARSLDRARDAIRELMQLAPEKATVLDAQGRWMDLDVSSVKVGALVLVKPGERIPLDGEVAEGRSSVNQAPITGESMPIEKGPGDPVFAGSINEHGSFQFRVTADQSHTTLARIVRAVEQAESEKAPVQRFVDRFAKAYTPAMVALAVAIAAIPPLFFSADFYPWLYRALVLLVIACPCALVISTPVTLVSALAGAARRGILIKGGSYLEEGHRLKVMAFDKTGTLTHGKPVVTDIVPLAGQSAETVLQVAASLDAFSEHPIAAAIVSRWTEGAGDWKLLHVQGFEAVPGRGVRGKIEEQSYALGNHRFAEENKICNPDVESRLERLETEGKTTVVLGTPEKAIAIFGVADTLRETSAKAVRSLEKLGISSIMLTGDNPTTARAIALQVGISDVRANLLPEEKLAVVKELREKFGGVGMAGDGINDAPALAQASIGFALGSNGTDTAIETADVAILRGDLLAIPEFVNLSRKAWSVLIQNISLAIGIKLIFFVLAFFGIATLWMAVFADMGASLIVVANGLRLLGNSQTV